MNYTVLKDKLNAELNDLLKRRADLRIVATHASDFEYAKICGQIIATYKAIIMVQEMEIEELSNKEV